MQSRQEIEQEVREVFTKPFRSWSSAFFMLAIAFGVYLMVAGTENPFLSVGFTAAVSITWLATIILDSYTKARELAIRKYEDRELKTIEKETSHGKVCWAYIKLAADTRCGEGIPPEVVASGLRQGSKAQRHSQGEVTKSTVLIVRSYYRSIGNDGAG